MIFKDYSVDQINEVQNMKRKDQFADYDTCGTVGDVRMDLTET